MALSPVNGSHNWRATYFEAVGDGTSTTIVKKLVQLTHANSTGTCYGVTAPALIPGTNNLNPNAGGLVLPQGTAISIVSAIVSGGNVTVTLTTALTLGTRGYFAFVLADTSAL